LPLFIGLANLFYMCIEPYGGPKEKNILFFVKIDRLKLLLYPYCMVLFFKKRLAMKNTIFALLLLPSMALAMPPKKEQPKSAKDLSEQERKARRAALEEKRKQQEISAYWKSDETRTQLNEVHRMQDTRAAMADHMRQDNIPALLNIVEQQTGNSDWNIEHVIQTGGIAALCGLISFGVPLNDFIENRTPLYIAAEVGNAAAARILLNRGVDVNKGTELTKETPLHKAAELGNVEIATMLLDAGCVVDQPDNRGSTPLLCAAQEGHVNVVQLLVERGANLRNVTNLLFNNALHKATEYGRSEAVRFLLEKASFLAFGYNKDGLAPIHMLFINDDLPLATIEQIVKIYEAHGICLDTMTLEDESTTLEYLVDADAAIDIIKLAQSFRGAIDIPCIKAAYNDNAALVRHFIQTGAKLDAVDRYANTAVHAACEVGAHACLEIVRDAGAITPAVLTTKNMDGKTPLDIALEHSDMHALQLLKPTARYSELEKLVVNHCATIHDIAQEDLERPIYQKHIRHKETASMPVNKQAASIAGSADDDKVVIRDISLILPTIETLDTDEDWQEKQKKKVNKRLFCYTDNTVAWFSNPEENFDKGVSAGKYHQDEHDRVILHHQLPLCIDGLIMHEDKRIQNEDGTYDIVLYGEIRHKDGTVEKGAFSYGIRGKECYHRSFTKSDRRERVAIVPDCWRDISSLQGLQGITVQQDEYGTSITTEDCPDVRFIIYHPIK